jgi:hypothetical protein
MDDQLDAFCAEMKADPKLADGVNILGFSQVSASPCLASPHTDVCAHIDDVIDAHARDALQSLAIANCVCVVLRVCANRRAAC